MDTEIQEIRNKWYSESLSERQVEVRLLATWRDLQRLREEQGYRNTGIQLVVKQKPGIGIEQWEKDVAVEVSEARNEALSRFEKMKVEYEKEYEHWRENMVSLHIIW